MIVTQLRSDGLLEIKNALRCLSMAYTPEVKLRLKALWLTEIASWTRGKFLPIFQQRFGQLA
jgi:hypothetical protein